MLLCALKTVRSRADAIALGMRLLFAALFV